MKRDELDAMIQYAMEKRTEYLNTDPMMLERIKREAASRERKERISMKLFTPKRIAVAAIVCFASVTCYAAVHFSGVESPLMLQAMRSLKRRKKKWDLI